MCALTNTRNDRYREGSYFVEASMFLVPLALIAAIALGVSPGAGALDSWRIAPDRRVVSPRGNYYFVLYGEARSDGKERRFELVKRRAGAPLLDPVEIFRGEGVPTSQPSFERDPKDELLAMGILDATPVEVRVLDFEAGAILYDRWGERASGMSMIRIDPRGRVRWKHSFISVPAENIASTMNGAHADIRYCCGWWVDDERAAVIVAAKDKKDQLRVLNIALRDGEVEQVGPEVLLEGLLIPSEAERDHAFNICAEEIPHLLAPQARRLFADPDAPMHQRLRAAEVLVSQGEKVNAGSLLLAAVAPGQPGRTRALAIAGLHQSIGDKALPILRDALLTPTSGDGSRVWSAAMDALAEVGEPAVPLLMEVLTETKNTTDARGGAAIVLGRIGSKQAGTLLRATISDPAEYVANAALNAAMALGGEALVPRLLECLEKGTTQDRMICSFFEKSPDPRAIDGLLAALERPYKYESDRNVVIDALRKCTGKNFGSDPKAWRDGLKK